MAFLLHIPVIFLVTAYFPIKVDSLAAFIFWIFARGCLYAVSIIFLQRYFDIRKAELEANKKQK